MDASIDEFLKVHASDYNGLSKPRGLIQIEDKCKKKSGLFPLIIKSQLTI